MQSSAITNNAASPRRSRSRKGCSISDQRRRCRLIWLLALFIAPLAPASDKVPTGKEAPSITITERGDQRIEEYRIAGRLYMIKITPEKGHPYYLIDSNGDGTLDSHRPELDENLFIPAWTLFRWR